MINLNQVPTSYSSLSQRRKNCKLSFVIVIFSWREKYMVNIHFLLLRPFFIEELQFSLVDRYGFYRSGKFLSDLV